MRGRPGDPLQRQLQHFGNHLDEVAPLSCAMLCYAREEHGCPVRVKPHICLRGVLANISISVDTHTDASPFCAVYSSGFQPSLPLLLPAELLRAFLHGP